jgi:hypothetical protein
MSKVNLGTSFAVGKNLSQTLIKGNADCSFRALPKRQSLA